MEITGRPVNVTDIHYQIQMRGSSNEEGETVSWRTSIVEGSLPGEDFLDLADAFALQVAEAYRAATTEDHFVVTRHYIGADSGAAVTVEVP